MLTDKDKERISAQVREIEARSGAEIVTAFTERCDHYPEIPWMAFALGAALTSAVLVLAGGLSGDRLALPLTLALALSLWAGLVLLLLTAVLPPFARLFLDPARAGAEARQYAEGLFLQHQLFATPARCAVLVLVARFERKVVILPDRGLQERLTPPVLDRIIAVITARLARDEVADAFAAGLATLEPLLDTQAPGAPGVGNQLPDEPIVTRES
jgi:putative membrane protein